MKKFFALTLIFLLNAAPALAAITDIGALLSNLNSVAGGISLSGTTSAALEANNVGIFPVITTGDCNTDGTGIVNTDEHTSATIDGQAMDKLHEACSEIDTNGPITISLWRKRALSTIDSGAAIVFNFSGAKVAAAALGREFSVTAGNTLDPVVIQELAENDVTPQAMTISGLTNISRLYLRALGLQRDTGGTFTVTAGFTSMGVANADTTNSATSRQARGEIQVFTGTGLASDPNFSVAGDSNEGK